MRLGVSFVSGHLGVPVSYESLCVRVYVCCVRL